MTVSVHEAKTQLSRLLDLLEQGEDIVIQRHGKPVARLVRASAAARPRIGSMIGEITWKEGWERSMLQPMTKPMLLGKAGDGSHVSSRHQHQLVDTCGAGPGFFRSPDGN